MDYSYLNDTLVLLAAAVATVALFQRLNLPPILGYLCVGVILGPHGLALIADTEHTRGFAEFGVVFLLFTIGLEFSLPLLIRMRGAVLGLGGSQVLLTTVATTLVALYFGLELESAIVLGGVVAMSSTALVIKQLTDQVELHSRHGRNAVGVLLFQDIMVIPFLILVSSFATASDESALSSLVTALGGGILALLLILALGRWAVQPLFTAVARFQSMELFTLAVLLVTLGAAWITHHMGLSLALGAFFAGMMLGETEFRHQVEAEIRPFRDILLGLFFITIGMLLNVGLLPEIWPQVIAVLLALIVFKLSLVILLCRLAGWDQAVALRTGLVLAHGGEFGFAILAMAMNSSLFDAEFGQIVLAALLLSMALAPLLIRYNGRLSALLLPGKIAQSRSSMRERIEQTAEGLRNHVIICGYGRVGQNVAQFLDQEHIPYVALDLDPVLVQNAIKAQQPVNYGDAANIELLKAAGLEHAGALVISLNDVETALKILHKARLLAPDIPILVRTDDDSELERLQAAGATEVIPETMEASLMLSSHLLLMLNVPVSRVFQRIRKARKNRYALLRQVFPGEEATLSTSAEVKQLRAIELPDELSEPLRLRDLKLEEKGILVTAILRHNQRIQHPDDDTALRAGDTLVLYGTPAALDQAELSLLQETLHII